MAISSAQVTVGAAAVALNAPEADPVGGATLIIKTDAANGVALGGSGVTAGNGYRPAVGTILGPIALPPGEQLFAIRTGGVDAVLDVLRLGS